MPYYLPGINIIDLEIPANLAFLKDSLLTPNPEERVSKLLNLGIKYFLFTPEYIEKLDSVLNSSIGEIAENPEFAIQIESFGGWILYEVGLFNTTT